MFVLLLLVQLLKFKIVLVAACFLIVESIEAHVGFLHLLGSIVKRGVRPKNYENFPKVSNLGK